MEWFDFLALKLMGNKSAAKMYFICTGHTHGSYLAEQWEIKIINVRNKTQDDTVHVWYVPKVMIALACP